MFGGGNFGRGVGLQEVRRGRPQRLREMLSLPHPALGTGREKVAVCRAEEALTKIVTTLLSDFSPRTV